MSTNLKETNRVFEEEVIGKRDFNALDRVYTRNARTAPAGAGMVSGLDGAKSLWQQTVSALGVTAVSLRPEEINADGDSAIEIGRATLTTDLAVSIEMEYAILWKCEDGDWKRHIDIWNLPAAS